MINLFTIGLIVVGVCTLVVMVLFVYRKKKTPPKIYTYIKCDSQYTCQVKKTSDQMDSTWKKLKPEESVESECKKICKIPSKPKYTYVQCDQVTGVCRHVENEKSPGSKWTRLPEGQTVEEWCKKCKKNPPKPPIIQHTYVKCDNEHPGSCLHKEAPNPPDGSWTLLRKGQTVQEWCQANCKPKPTPPTPKPTPPTPKPTPIQQLKRFVTCNPDKTCSVKFQSKSPGPTWTELPQSENLDKWCTQTCKWRPNEPVNPTPSECGYITGRDGVSYIPVPKSGKCYDAYKNESREIHDRCYGNQIDILQKRSFKGVDYCNPEDCQNHGCGYSVRVDNKCYIGAKDQLTCDAVANNSCFKPKGMTFTYKEVTDSVTKKKYGVCVQSKYEYPPWVKKVNPDGPFSFNFNTPNKMLSNSLELIDPVVGHYFTLVQLTNNQWVLYNMDKRMFVTVESPPGSPYNIRLVYRENPENATKRPYSFNQKDASHNYYMKLNNDNANHETLQIGYYGTSSSDIMLIMGPLSDMSLLTFNHASKKRQYLYKNNSSGDAQCVIPGLHGKKVTYGKPNQPCPQGYDNTWTTIQSKNSIAHVTSGCASKHPGNEEVCLQTDALTKDMKVGNANNQFGQVDHMVNADTLDKYAVFSGGPSYQSGPDELDQELAGTSSVLQKHYQNIHGLATYKIPNSTHVKQFTPYGFVSTPAKSGQTLFNQKQTYYLAPNSTPTNNIQYMGVEGESTNDRLPRPEMCNDPKNKEVCENNGWGACQNGYLSQPFSASFFQPCPTPSNPNRKCTFQGYQCRPVGYTFLSHKDGCTLAAEGKYEKKEDCEDDNVECKGPEMFRVRDNKNISRCLRTIPDIYKNNNPRGWNSWSSRNKGTYYINDFDIQVGQYFPNTDDKSWDRCSKGDSKYDMNKKTCSSQVRYLQDDLPNAYPDYGDGYALKFHQK